VDDRVSNSVLKSDDAAHADGITACRFDSFELLDTGDIAQHRQALWLRNIR